MEAEKEGQEEVNQKQKKKRNQQIVTNIENLKRSNPKEFWKQLKKLNEIKDRNSVPNKIRNDENEWVTDKAVIIEVWAKAFEKLGMNEEKKGFDEKFANQIRESLRGKESKKHTNGRDPDCKR